MWLSSKQMSKEVGAMKDARTEALDELKEKLEAMDLAGLKQVLGFIAGVNAGSAANAA